MCFGFCVLLIQDCLDSIRLAQKSIRGTTAVWATILATIGAHTSTHPNAHAHTQTCNTDQIHDIHSSKHFKSIDTMQSVPLSNKNALPSSAQKRSHADSTLKPQDGNQRESVPSTKKATQLLHLPHRAYNLVGRNGPPGTHLRPTKNIRKTVSEDISKQYQSIRSVTDKPFAFHGSAASMILHTICVLSQLAKHPEPFLLLYLLQHCYSAQSCLRRSQPS